MHNLQRSSRSPYGSNRGQQVLWPACYRPCAPREWSPSPPWYPQVPEGEPVLPPQGGSAMTEPTSHSRFRVVRCQRRVDHKNPISGHEWSTYELLQAFEVHGPFVMPNQFKTEKAAQAHADVLEQMEKKFPFECPRSPRELAWSRHVDTMCIRVVP